MALLPTKYSVLPSVLLFTLAINTVPAKPSAMDLSKVSKRSYYPWAAPGTPSGVSLLNAANVYKPSPYTITRPYYIPVYGLSGGNYLFYPPQPLYTNVGSPPDNPMKPAFQGPTYLPPKEKPPQEGGDINNRFGEDDDDDRPVWGGAAMNTMPLSGDQPKEWSVVPTRPPGAALRPAPPLIRDPVSTSESSTPARPPAPPPGPSNCVWAIISCCSATDPSVLPQNCFEARGCPGPFWGDSPCMGEYAKAAIDSAVKYFGEG
ncbi:uncharacterized protein LOC126741299 [Anthonomus grandis grandis]|uniref:uncharacterized protein LOC126741299 n=1 Tax=Anthonomus grandis grandis TaxID=2921223 RepID=UPI002165AD99|nr:uncharacterized protein LOC126741299 [Anthonomus grandis grandis]XP_050303645.1 uncharacterized protein LOC126741299 [Anthonomus grandis grandis]XP_050303646.1 uncharacterized protein LOC126741299 [Anthonomus grandis grandis]